MHKLTLPHENLKLKIYHVSSKKKLDDLSELMLLKVDQYQLNSLAYNHYLGVLHPLERHA